MGERAEGRAEAGIGRLWRPVTPDDAPDPFEAIQVRPADWYVTVDDIDGDRTHLVASTWPSLDGDGRLVFPGFEDQPADEGPVADPSSSEITVDTGRFQVFVDRWRAERRQLAPDRDVRVGDTFWFRGELPRQGEGIEGQAIDVTFAARAEAKAAMAWAIGGPQASRVIAAAEVERARRRGVDAAPPPGRPPVPGRPSLPGSVAGPSV